MSVSGERAFQAKKTHKCSSPQAVDKFDVDILEEKYKI